MKKQVSEYKEIRSLIQFGDFYRLLSPFEGNETAWLFTNKEKTEAMVYYFRVLAEPAAPLTILRVRGLDLNKKYRVIGTDRVFSGDELSFVGISSPVSINGDFQSFVWHLKEFGI